MINERSIRNSIITVSTSNGVIKGVEEMKMQLSRFLNQYFRNKANLDLDWK